MNGVVVLSGLSNLSTDIPKKDRETQRTPIYYII